MKCKLYLKKSLTLVAAFFLMVITVQGQSRVVQGTVTDASGLPIVGVSVTVEGTTTGVTTDGNGKYGIRVSSDDAVLEFNFLGYAPASTPVGQRSVIDMVLDDGAEDIDEVVVIGYGTVRKRDLTGSVASVGADKIEGRSYSNVMQSLSGQLPGVQITQSSGAPGFAPSIRIRGASSINSGTTPLYVIDGVPIEDRTNSSGTNSSSDLTYNQNPLNMINPNDIESVEILKDASSAAIYGSRGANGVVLITTKSGKAGKTVINASYELGISQVARKVKMMNGPEFIDWSIAARNNSYITDYGGSPSDPNSLRPSGGQTDYWIPEEFYDPYWLNKIGNGTDWQDVIFRTGITHNFNVSASGGNEKTQFMISGAYLDTEGVVDNDYYERFNLRSNLNHKISDKFSTGMNISLSRTSNQSFGTAGKSDAVSYALQSDPIFPAVNDVGTYSHRDPESEWYVFQPYGFQLWNPLAITRESENKTIQNNILATTFVNYNIWDNLSFKTSVSANVIDQSYSDYRYEGQKWGMEQYREAVANHKTRQVYNWLWENTLNYRKTIGDHFFTGLLGYTAQKERIDNSEMAASNFPNDLVQTLNAGTVNSGSTDATEWALLSYIFRGTYSYKDKYLFSAAIRADGSSRFGSNSRWGYFPSASAAYRISEENWMANTRNWMDNLKFRVSYGVTGNNLVDNYAAVSQLSYSNYVLDNKINTGMYSSSYVDENLKWEKTSQVNVGLDASFLNSRINITYDYYYSVTRDLLLNVPIPTISGYSSTLTNIGKVENQGMELNITTRNLIREFKWSTDFNISGNRNKVLALGRNDAPIFINTDNCWMLIEVGQPIGNYYGYVHEGVIMSAAEMATYPVWPGSEPGDPKIKDVDKSGAIDEGDRTIIGNYQPKFTWGLTNNFAYKGFDLSVMITGRQGGEIFNQQARFSGVGRVRRNAYQRNTNFWKSESDPGNGWEPKPRSNANTVQNLCNSYWIEDGSFVRIKNIRIGYNFPSRVTERLRISALKLYLNIENVHVFSDYVNYDPEASSFQTGMNVGMDFASYPNPRVWTIGLNLTF